MKWKTDLRRFKEQREVEAVEAILQKYPSFAQKWQMPIEEVRGRLRRANKGAEAEQLHEEIINKLHSWAAEMAQNARSILALAGIRKLIDHYLSTEATEKGESLPAMVKMLRNELGNKLTSIGQEYLDNAAVLFISFSGFKDFDWALVIVEVTKALEEQLRDTLWGNILLGLCTEWKHARIQIPWGKGRPTISDTSNILSGQKSGSKYEQLHCSFTNFTNRLDPPIRDYILRELGERLPEVVGFRNKNAHSCKRIEENEARTLSRMVLPYPDGLLAGVANLKQE